MYYLKITERFLNVHFERHVYLFYEIVCCLYTGDGEHKTSEYC